MRKFIIAASIAALAVALTAGAANAAVTYDTSTAPYIPTGHADKGDVQHVLGWNENKMQNTPVEFTTNWIINSDQSWQCADGEIRNRHETYTFTQEVAATKLLHKTTGKITGWDLTGTVPQTIEFVGVTTTGPEADNCQNAEGGSMGYRPISSESHIGYSNLFVNEVPLPLTPAA